MKKSGIEAGWYPDPSGEAVERWWDGGAWTAHVRTAGSPGPQATTGAPTAEASRPSRRRAAALAVIGLLGMLGGVGGVLWSGLGDDAVDESEGEADAVDEPDGQEGGVDEPQGPEPTDLRTVDWTTVTWTTACTESGELEEVRLAPAGREGFGPLVYDAFPDAEIPGQVYSVELQPEVYGDITGDGLDDAIFITSCFFGNFFVHSVEVWGHHEGGEPTHLPPVFGFSKFDGTIDHVEVVDGRLRVLTHEPMPGDSHPHLNGYPVEVVTDWRYQAQRWTAEQVSWIAPGEYGSDPYLDDLYDACAADDVDACRSLYFESPVDSGYEFYGRICGERTQTFCWDP